MPHGQRRLTEFTISPRKPWTSHRQSDSAQSLFLLATWGLACLSAGSHRPAAVHRLVCLGVHRPRDLAMCVSFCSQLRPALARAYGYGRTGPGLFAKGGSVPVEGERERGAAHRGLRGGAGMPKCGVGHAGTPDWLYRANASRVMARACSFKRTVCSFSFK